MQIRKRNADWGPQEVNRRFNEAQGQFINMLAEPGNAWLAKDKKGTKLVFIGRKLPQDIFTQGLENCLV